MLPIEFCLKLENFYKDYLHGKEQQVQFSFCFPWKKWSQVGLKQCMNEENNDRIFIFGWTFHLSVSIKDAMLQYIVSLLGLGTETRYHYGTGTYGTGMY